LQSRAQLNSLTIDFGRPMSEAMTKAGPPRRFRFSLRTMLALVIVVAIPLAWIAKERQRSASEQQLAERLRAEGFREVTLGGAYDSFELNFSRQPQGRWRNLARRVLGERIVTISGPPRDYADLSSLAGLTSLQTLILTGAQVSDLAPLAGLTGLHWLDITANPVRDLTPLSGHNNMEQLGLGSSPATDLSPLVRMKKLRILYLDSASFSDVTPLAELNSLESLSLFKTEVSDLAPLAGLTRLANLSVMQTPVTQQQYSALQQALPQCVILHDPFPLDPAVDPFSPDPFSPAP
jgi:hypothetical protein